MSESEATHSIRSENEVSELKVDVKEQDESFESDIEEIEEVECEQCQQCHEVVDQASLHSVNVGMSVAHSDSAQPSSFSTVSHPPPLSGSSSFFQHQSTPDLSQFQQLPSTSGIFHPIPPKPLRVTACTFLRFAFFCGFFCQNNVEYVLKIFSHPFSVKNHTHPSAVNLDVH